MNSRIKELRKALNLNQSDFGAKIGLKQSAVANYENGTRKPLDTVITSICKEFLVSETWLRTGEGEMFVSKSQEDLLREFVDSLTMISDDDFKKKIVTALAKMDAQQWAAFKKIMDVFLAEFAETPEKKSDMDVIEEETDRFRQELIKEKKRESEASGSAAEKMA